MRSRQLGVIVAVAISLAVATLRSGIAADLGTESKVEQATDGAEKATATESKPDAKTEEPGKGDATQPQSTTAGHEGSHQCCQEGHEGSHHGGHHKGHEGSHGAGKDERSH